MCFVSLRLSIMWMWKSVSSITACHHEGSQLGKSETARIVVAATHMDSGWMGSSGLHKDTWHRDISLHLLQECILHCWLCRNRWFVPHAACSINSIFWLQKHSIALHLTTALVTILIIRCVPQLVFHKGLSSLSSRKNRFQSCSHINHWAKQAV